MADEKKPEPKRQPKPLSAELVAEELRAALPGELPAIDVDASGVVRLAYQSAAQHAARCSADVEALRAMPGYALLESAQAEHRPHPAAPIASVAVVCLLARRS